MKCDQCGAPNQIGVCAYCRTNIKPEKTFPEYLQQLKERAREFNKERQDNLLTALELRADPALMSKIVA